MNIAIITGASSGLGREFALQICQNYASEIDEIWLLARRKESLLALAPGNFCHRDLCRCRYADGHYR